LSSDTPSNRRLVRAARRFAQLPGGRRTKFAVIGVWLLIAMAIGPLSGKFEEVQRTTRSTTCPVAPNPCRR